MVSLLDFIDEVVGLERSALLNRRSMQAPEAILMWHDIGGIGEGRVSDLG